MKRQDVLFALGAALVLCPFFIFPAVFAAYERLNIEHGLLLSFVKFAVLATTGEVIGLRIRTGAYSAPGFGVLPRAVVWGFLGLGIYVAFAIFSQGAPASLRLLGIPVTADVMKGPLSGHKVLGSFWISLTMNAVFAPVMMTVHKITDEHITRHGGLLSGLLRPIDVGGILAKVNWSVMWGFVFKKTIPRFWIPAHTLTFLLPPQHRVLFAAALGVVLGVLLAVASRKPAPVS